MNLKSLAFQIVVLSIFLKFDVFDRKPLRAFVNLPFEKQLPYFSEFKKWIEEYRGKINMI